MKRLSSLFEVAARGATGAVACGETATSGSSRVLRPPGCETHTRLGYLGAGPSNQVSFGNF